MQSLFELVHVCVCVLIMMEAIRWCQLKEMSLLSFMQSFDTHTISLVVYTDLNPTPCTMSHKDENPAFTELYLDCVSSWLYDT